MGNLRNIDISIVCQSFRFCNSQARSLPCLGICSTCTSSWVYLYNNCVGCSQNSSVSGVRWKNFHFQRCAKSTVSLRNQQPRSNPQKRKKGRNPEENGWKSWRLPSFVRQGHQIDGFSNSVGMVLCLRSAAGLAPLQCLSDLSRDTLQEIITAENGSFSVN